MKCEDQVYGDKFNVLRYWRRDQSEFRRHNLICFSHVDDIYLFSMREYIEISMCVNGAIQHEGLECVERVSTRTSDGVDSERTFCV